MRKNEMRNNESLKQQNCERARSEKKNIKYYTMFHCSGKGTLESVESWYDDFNW